MEQGRRRRSAAPSKAERRAEAKAKGYEGEMCGECGNFTLVRNGTCMKCDTCGARRGVRRPLTNWWMARLNRRRAARKNGPPFA